MSNHCICAATDRTDVVATGPTSSRNNMHTNGHRQPRLRRVLARFSRGRFFCCGTHAIARRRFCAFVFVLVRSCTFSSVQWRNGWFTYAA
jgi:hypothetical protein